MKFIPERKITRNSSKRETGSRKLPKEGPRRTAREFCQALKKGRDEKGSYREGGECHRRVIPVTVSIVKGDPRFIGGGEGSRKVGRRGGRS